MNEFFDSLTWQGNSRAMLDAVIAGTPIFFRGILRERIKRWAQDRQLTVIDEDTVFQAVDDLAPPDMARSAIKPELEKLRSR